MFDGCPVFRAFCEGWVVDRSHKTTSPSLTRLASRRTDREPRRRLESAHLAPGPEPPTIDQKDRDDTRAADPHGSPVPCQLVVPRTLLLPCSGAVPSPAREHRTSQDSP